MRSESAPPFCPPPVCRREDLIRIKAPKDPLSHDVKPGETVAFKCRRCGLFYAPKDIVGAL